MELRVERLNTSDDGLRIDGKLYINDEFFCDVYEEAMTYTYTYTYTTCKTTFQPYELERFPIANDPSDYFIKKGIYNVLLKWKLALYTSIKLYLSLTCGMPIIEGCKQGSVEFSLKMEDAKSHKFKNGIIVPRELYIALYERLLEAHMIDEPISITIC